jgi:hypothetical protein
MIDLENRRGSDVVVGSNPTPATAREPLTSEIGQMLSPFPPPGHDDMDLFILVLKLDAYGTPLQQFTVPNQGARIRDVTERGASILRYKGSDGRLRVSMRHLDEKLSTEAIPAHSFDRVEELSPGEVVDVEIDLLPVGLTFYPGEQLRLVISGRSLLGTMMPGNREYTPANKGQHIVHTGGERASYLQIPVKPA